MTAEQTDALRRTARESFGWDHLRPGQLEAMTAAVSGTDVLAIMPTGHGKSAVYQVPALLLRGPTLVISPLIALQADQIAGIDDAPDAGEAVALNSAQAGQQQRDAWRAVQRGGAEFLFLAPEQLAKDEVLDRLAGAELSLVVVDEAHCVSSWGHDFRPDYLRLAEAIDRLGHPTVVALSATAAPPVREEIIERLALRDPRVVVRGFDRPNLRLEVSRQASDGDKRQQVVDHVAGLEGPGLVYAATRKDTEHYAEALAGRGLRASAYHAGQKAAQRRAVHEDFLSGAVDVVVATSAFGMGIDKPDVRYVVHAAVPESLDAYYQQIGRAGRDDQPALAYLHYRPEDLGMRRFFAGGQPDEDVLRRVHHALLRAGRPLRAKALKEQLDLALRTVTGTLNLLEDAGAVRSTSRGFRATGLGTDDAVHLAVERARARQRVEQSRIEMMRGYAEEQRCRRQVLLSYFGDELEEPCGNCDNCADGTQARAADQGRTSSGSADAPFPASAHVRHRLWGPGVVMDTEVDRVTVFFEDQGYRTLELATVADNDLLALEES